jgi:hypothetical protein
MRRNNPKTPKRNNLYPSDNYVSETEDSMLNGVKKYDSAEKIEHNTMHIKYPNGAEAIRFHQTDIVTWKDGLVKLNGAGYCPTSQRTRERINWYANQCGADVHVFVRDGKCYIEHDGTVKPYVDGKKYDCNLRKPKWVPEGKKRAPEEKVREVIGAKKAVADRKNGKNDPPKNSRYLVIDLGERKKGTTKKGRK